VAACGLARSTAAYGGLRRRLWGLLIVHKVWVTLASSTQQCYSFIYLFQCSLFHTEIFECEKSLGGHTKNSGGAENAGVENEEVECALAGELNAHKYRNNRNKSNSHSYRVDTLVSERFARCALLILIPAIRFAVGMVMRVFTRATLC